MNAVEIARKIWADPELSLKEYNAEKLYAQALREEGFVVEEGVGGIPTAVFGHYGSGRPMIAILGEYDALSGVGHGCGHNLLGAGAFEAAVGVKNWLRRSGHAGTVYFCGCPGEEGGAAKAFFARDGLWKQFDAAVSWHPSTRNQVVVGTSTSTIQVLYKFKGVASRAAGSPEKGRSALDAVELMNIGVQFLREHMPGECRVHYAILNSGGISPNVVQDHAEVLYMTRAIKVADCVALQERVDRIADGAVLMTDTSYERVFVDGCANQVPNRTLEELMQGFLENTPLPDYTEEDEAEALAIARTLDPKAKMGIDKTIYPLGQDDYVEAGSTDVGDVSWQTPTVQVNTACFAFGSPGHSVQNNRSAGSPFGEKAMMQAAEIMRKTAIALYEDEELLARAKAEFEEKTKEGFVSPIPEGCGPYVIEV